MEETLKPRDFSLATVGTHYSIWKQIRLFKVVSALLYFLEEKLLISSRVT